MKRALYGLTTVSFMLMLNHAYLTNVPFKNHLELSDYLLVYASNDLSQDVLIIETYDQNHQLIDVGQYKAGDAWVSQINDDHLIILGGGQTILIDLDNGNVSKVDGSYHIADGNDITNQFVVSDTRNIYGTVVDVLCVMDQFPLGANCSCVDSDYWISDILLDGQTIYTLVRDDTTHRVLAYDAETLKKIESFRFDDDGLTIVGIDVNHHLIVENQTGNWIDVMNNMFIDPKSTQLIKASDPADLLYDSFEQFNTIDTIYHGVVATIDHHGGLVAFFDADNLSASSLLYHANDPASRYPWFNLRMIGAVWTGEKP